MQELMEDVSALMRRDGLYAGKTVVSQLTMV
jgi:hypothetical protein